MAEEFFRPATLPVVEQAAGTTKKGEYKALTPLQRKVDARGQLSETNAGPTSPNPAEYKGANADTVATRKAATAQRVQEETATPFVDAFKETAGGVVRDLYRAANRAEGAKGVDPSYDAGEYRESFRSNYEEEHWPHLERTTNKSQYDALIQTLEEKRKTENIQAQSMTGTIVGSLFDPTIFAGGAALKAAQIAAKSYRISKGAALAGSAALEGGVYAGAEAAVQTTEFGDVYDKDKVGTTLAIAGLLHFGVGSLAVPKSSFVSQKLLDEEAEGVAMREASRKELALHFEQQAARLQEGKVTMNDLEQRLGVNRTFPASAYPEPKATVAVPTENALADAGSAANSGRVDALADPIIRSESDAVQDRIDLLTREDEVFMSSGGKKAVDYLTSKVGQASVYLSNTYQGMVSSNPVVRSAARLMGADSAGLARGIEKPTAYDKSILNNRMRNHYSAVHDEYKSWVKRNGQSGWTAEMSTTLEQKFNKALRAEMEARWTTKDLDKLEMDELDNLRWKDTPPEVKRAADALDKGNQIALDEMKRHGVMGAEGLGEVSRGYVPRRMDGRALQDLYRADSTKFQKLQQALGERYHRSFVAQQDAAKAYLRENIKEVIAKDLAERTEELTRNFKGMQDELDLAISKLKPTTLADELAKMKPITREKAQTIATGVMDRAIKRAAGVDGSTLGLLDRAARSEIKNILESKGMDYSEIEHTFKLVDKRLGGRTGSNRLKGRMEVDIHTPTDDGINFLDYFDNDLNKLNSSYSEEMSGRIALARQGVDNDNDFEHIINAAANTGAKDTEIQLLRDMYSQLLGRPIKGQGENKVIQFLTQINPLQSLGQVGVAQGAESSLGVARLGIGSFLKSVPMMAKILVGARKGLLTADDKKVLDSVEAWIGPIGEMWRTHRPRTEVLERLNADGAIAHQADRMLKVGQHINGFISGMHQVMEAQLKAVAIEGTRVFAKEIQKGVLTKRIADAGFTEQTMKAFKAELDAHATFKGGKLYDLGIEKWDYQNAEGFMRNIERISGQLIQKDFAGETASWMHRDLGRMFLSLRGYSVKAFNKQLVRNVRIADAVAANSVLTGLAFSTLGYTAKVHVASLGREDKEEFLNDRLSGASLVQGAVGYIAFGSFVPELLRPLASWSTDPEQAGAVRTGSNAVVALLPALAPIDRAITAVDNLGTAAGKKIRTGESGYTAANARQLASTLLGNNFGVVMGMNAVTEDDD